MKNMKIINSLFILIITSFVLVSCNQDTKDLLPNVTGKTGEVVAVLSPQYKDGKVVEELKLNLSKPQHGLSKDEPIFDLIIIPKTAFKAIFKTHRNLLYLKISKNFKEANIKASKNLHAAPQSVLYLEAPNVTEMVNLIATKNEQIKDFFLEADRNRTISYYKARENKKISNALEKDHGIKMIFPKTFNLDVNNKNFVWCSYEAPLTGQGVLIYHYPYQDTSDLSKERLLAVRDSVCKKYIPGPAEGSYMTTEREFIIPKYTQYQYKDRYVAELRGTWKLVGDFMGGPFVSLTSVDEKNNRVITVEGYVFSPKYDERDYLRQVESILYTFDYADNKTATKK